MYSVADMKSRHSNSLILIWRIAELEARHQNASTIEPTHLLLGLCKVVDLDLPELVSKDSPDRDEVLEELLREVRKLRTVFRAAGLDAKKFRRRLRSALPEPRSVRCVLERLHRNAAAKRVFEDANRFAQLGSGTVYPIHLLYASLLAENSYRDTALATLTIDKKRLLTAVEQAVILPKSGDFSPSHREKTRWN